MSQQQPDFVIVGAMKAGTTSLYAELARHPGVFLPADKEPETLVSCGDDLARVRADYASLYAPAAAGQLCGEASTAYTKRPQHEDVAQRALALCEGRLKVIYLRREPIGRMVSQYWHEQGRGEQPKALAEALLTDPRYVDYSRYDWQIAPWKAAFGSSQVLELEFEALVAEREATLRRVARFLDIDPEPLLAAPAARANVSAGKPTPRGWLRRVIESRWYRRQVKSRLPQGVRERLKHWLSPKARVRQIELDDATRQTLLQRLAQAPASATAAQSP